MYRIVFFMLDDDKNVVPIEGGTEQERLMRWAAMLEDDGCRYVAFDEVEGVQVSTVFLGLDHGYGMGPPLVFETMIFGGGEGLDMYQVRYSYWDDAVRGHARALAAVRAVLHRRRAIDSEVEP